MATPIKSSLVDHSALDGTGDAINGSEVDENGNTLADLLDGTSTTVLGQAASVSFEAIDIFQDANAAGSIQNQWVYEWDPADGGQMTDNSSGLGMVWKMPDASDNQTEFANLDVVCVDDTASSGEEGEFIFSVALAGTMTEVLTLGSGAGTVFNEPGSDLDFRIETNNIANAFVVDGGLDVFSFGAAAADDKFVTISPPAATHTADTDTYALHVTAGGAQTIPSGTTTLVASVAVEEPNITATGTVTNAATVYIKNAPSEGSNNYALWVDAGNVKLDGDLTVDGDVNIGNAVISEAELETIDGITAGTVAASKAVVVDSNKDAASFRNITLTGELDAATLDISGNADIDGTTNLDAVDIDGAVQIDATVSVGVNDQGYDVKFFGDTASAYLLWDTSADKLLTAGGATIDIVKDKLLIGGTAVTTTAAELNVLDAVTAGTVAASKAVVVDSNKDAASFRNITLTGELDAATLDLSGAADIAGDLTLSAGADGALVFANAGENSIKIPDNQASSLIIEEANNAYLTFVTTNSGEQVTIGKKLDVGGSFECNTDGVVKWGSSKDFGLLTWDTGKAIVGGQSGKALEFQAGGSLAATIDTGGEFIINGTSGTGPLTVWANSGASCTRLVGRNNGTTDEAELLFTHNDESTAHGNITGKSTGLYFAGGTTAAMNLASDGGVFFSNLLAASASTDVNINGSNELHSVTSSGVYKEDYSVGIGSDRVLDLQPRAFTWRHPVDAPDGWAQQVGDPGRRDFGLIAEEVAEVMPELVNYKDGQPYSVRYQMMSVLLLEQLQKLVKKSNNLQHKEI